MKNHSRYTASRSFGVLFILSVVAAVCVMPAAALPVLKVGPLAFALAGSTETTTTLSELMKITFDDTIVSEAITDTELMDLFPDGEVKRGPEGRYFETASLYQNPGSIGSRGESGYIPVPNGAKAKNGRITLKKLVGSIEETAEVLKKINNDVAAFTNWAEEQFPRFKENLADEYDRQLIGDGSGIRARVNAAIPATTLIIDSTIGIAGLDHALLQFRRGMNLRASANHDGSAPRALTMNVTDLDWDNNAIIVDQLATALADNDYLFEGDAADNSAGKDMMGLYGMVDDGNIVQTLQNIDRSTYKWFKSYVNDNNSADVIDETMLIETDRQARLRGGGKVDTIITSEDAFNAVWQALKADRMISDPRAYTGGRKGVDIMFGGTRTINLRTARKLPSKVVFGLQRDQFRKFILHDWEWDDTTGSIWKQVVDATGRKDAFYAYGSSYGEMGIKSPQRCWRIDDFLLEPA